MFIQTEQTPNPATLKFLPGCAVMESGTANFTDPRSASRSPLAERLFALPEVTGVFLAADFITITKNGDSDWPQLKPAVLAAIMEHFTAGRPVILAEAGEDANAAEGGEEDDEIVTQIKELLETRVRPAVANDGGAWMLMTARPSGAAITVSGPLSRTAAPLRLAACRARSTLPAPPARSGNSRRNSPS